MKRLLYILALVLNVTALALPPHETGKSLMPAILELIAWDKEHFNEVVTD